MKANEAPEKIYIDDFGSELSHDWHTEHCYEKDIEYTRTDAFIEKACETFCKVRCNGKPPRSTCTSLGTCCEHDDFRKALKDKRYDRQSTGNTSKIATRKLCTMDEHMAFYNDKAKEDYEFLCEIEEFMKALQEEHVSEVWHDANVEQPEKDRTVVVWNPTTMDGEVLTRCAEVYEGRIWAYIDDILKLSNVQRTTKDWKEPVSEDLEEEINRYLSYRSSSPQNPIEFNRDLARHFANWQKQQMMKEAIDAQVQLETCGHGSMCLGLSLPFGVLEKMKLKEGNNVKLRNNESRTD